MSSSNGERCNKQNGKDRNILAVLRATIFVMKSQRIGRIQRPLIIGNWKMNPQDEASARTLASSIKKGVGKKYAGVDVYVAPPFPFLSVVASSLRKGSIVLSAQNVSAHEKGAHTGEVSTGMLQTFDVRMVIIGHSERRASGETDADINAKMLRVLKSRMTAVVCVGEISRDSHGDYFSVIESQVRSALTGVTPAQLKNIVIAYEPVWAIGTGKNATGEDVQEMKLFLQKCIAELYDRKAVAKVRIIYGGSVSKDTAVPLLEEGNIDGFLIGGASLKADEFITIVDHAQRYARK